MNWNLLISVDALRAVSVYLFLGVVILTYLKYVFFSNEVDRNGVQKIIGGLSVFVVAIISDHPTVLFASLFIGGLIIASEDFMKSLAAIFKSRSDKIPETISALNVEKASKNELEKKQLEEVKDIEKTIETSETSKGPASSEKKYEAIRDLYHKIKEAEDAVLNYFSDQYGPRFIRQVRLTSPGETPVIADGILKYTDNIQAVVEVQYLRVFNISVRRRLSDTLVRFRSLLPAQWIVFGLVFDNEEVLNRTDFSFLFRMERVRAYLFILKEGKIKLIKVINE